MLVIVTLKVSHIFLAFSTDWLFSLILEGIYNSFKLSIHTKELSKLQWPNIFLKKKRHWSRLYWLVLHHGNGCINYSIGLFNLARKGYVMPIYSKYDKIFGIHRIFRQYITIIFLPYILMTSWLNWKYLNHT